MRDVGGGGGFGQRDSGQTGESKGWLAIAKLKPLVEREFLSTNEKA